MSPNILTRPILPSPFWRQRFAVLLGVLILVLVTAGGAALGFGISRFMSSHNAAPYVNPTLALGGYLVFILQIAAGFVPGRMIKKHGWMYGGLVGIIASVLSLITLIIAYFYIDLGQEKSSDYLVVAQQIFLPSLVIAGLKLTTLTAIGGFIGEKTARPLLEAPKINQ